LYRKGAYGVLIGNALITGGEEMKQAYAMLLAGMFVISGCVDVPRQSDQEQQQPSQVTTNQETTDPPGPAASPEPTQAREGEPEGESEVIADQLEIPWSIEQSGDTFYITERSGNIAKINNGTVERQAVKLKKELATASEAGLLGFVLAADFAESSQAYAYYTYKDQAAQYNRIVRLQLEADGGGGWQEIDVLVDQIPSGSVHHGGRLQLGPDGLLYATTGDASETDLAQDPKSLGGKILRINLDGSVPADNPFPDSYVYSLGHRNPQGLAWLPDGTMYASEHGSSANDEINVIAAGGNYGWPLIRGNEEQEGLLTPLFTSGDEATWAPSGMAHYQGKLYVAALRGTAVLEFDLQTQESRKLISDLGRIRDVRVVDNRLYFVSNNTDGRGAAAESDDKLYVITLPEG